MIGAKPKPKQTKPVQKKKTAAPKKKTAATTVAKRNKRGGAALNTNVKPGGSPASESVMKCVRGGSPASDILCDAVDTGAYDVMSKNADNTFEPLTVRVFKGGALVNTIPAKFNNVRYKLVNQRAGSGCTNTTEPGTATPGIPTTLPQPSGVSAYDYNALPQGIVTGLSQPSTTFPVPSSSSVTYPSYYSEFMPAMTYTTVGGKKKRATPSRKKRTSASKTKPKPKKRTSASKTKPKKRTSASKPKKVIARKASA